MGGGCFVFLLNTYFRCYIPIVSVNLLTTCHKDTHIYELYHSVHHLQYKEVCLCMPGLHCDLCGSLMPYGAACPLLWWRCVSNVVLCLAGLDD